jgi:UDP-N-acetyl-D-glucosamine dehydrogenase
LGTREMARASTDQSAVAMLADAIATRTAVVGVIGLGYVGLPLAIACGRAGFSTIGFDIDPEKIVQLDRGNSYIDAVPDDALSVERAAGRFSATSNVTRLADCDVIVICVPTPLSRNREPDLRFIEATVETIATHLRSGQLIVLESTTYPGTTEEIVIPALERSGMKSGIDFLVGFSPEREDPGNKSFHTTSIPKVVAGDGLLAAEMMEAFYGAVVDKVVTVSAPRVAEAVKITENVFRAVNVALVNELKVIFKAMDIDVWEVINAAATKPFGYMPFYPGPGLGGHCIPIDPFYLTWRAREFGVATRFIELAGEINVAMPHYVVSQLDEALDRTQGKSLGSSRVLIIGIAYKKNVADMRESPALHLMDLLDRRGTDVCYHDPHVALIPPTREHAALAGRASVALTADDVALYDAILIATDHDNVDYALIHNHARLIVDTRNVMEKNGLSGDRIVKA